MSNYCSYKDCQNIHRAFSSKTFFNLPNDDRRAIWINNSGNEKLQNLDASLRRVFCEDHFDPKYLRRQFNRTILRRDAIPYPYGEAPASQEIEYFEMAEIDDEPEQSQSDTIDPPNESNQVVILLNKSVNARNHQRKASNILNSRQIPNKNSNEMILTMKKDSERKPEKDEMIDFIVLEEDIPDEVDNQHEPVENEETDQSTSKKMRLEVKETPHQRNGSSQFEKMDEMAILKPSPQSISDVVLPRNSTDGIVSSSETVDANNEETYFALSLVGILKRLPPHKRAIAKCHILSYLTELEYGSASIS